MKTGAYFFVVLMISSCGDHRSYVEPAPARFQKFLADYHETRMSLFPTDATTAGESKYNGHMYPNFTDGRRAIIKKFYTATLDSLHLFNRDSLSANDMLSYDFINYFVPLQLRALDFKSNLIPTDQMWGEDLRIPAWANGEGAQPFATVQDYDLWLNRLHDFSAWLDSAIVYFRMGVQEKYTLPKPIVRSMIPQYETMITKDAETSLFYTPVKKLPASFSAEDKKRLTLAYTAMITQSVIPAYKRMTEFLKTEYLPAARSSTTGISALSDGAERYRLAVKMETTTDMTPDEIKAIGLREVERVHHEMEEVKNKVGYHGPLNKFLVDVRRDPKLMPFQKPEDVLNAFRSIQAKIAPRLPEFFTVFPKTPFEIRRTEQFREKTASIEYVGSPDNKKPGIFYIPIPDARQYNISSGMESTFLHEAIPGHHFQGSLQSENPALPAFRRKNVELGNAYMEGWALYAESLGKDLGLYGDPYQRLGALGDEILRDIRLVVDVSLHTGTMNREQAIKYMMENQVISEQNAVAEVERYIAYPGQALSYKIGALKIAEIRDRCRAKLGKKFSIAKFHDEILKDGTLPLQVLEQKMDRWLATQ